MASAHSSGKRKISRFSPCNGGQPCCYVDRLSGNSRTVVRVPRLRVGPEILKIHSNLIRAVTCAGFAYLIGIGSMAAAIGVIRVETVVWNRNDQRAVAVNVDAARSRPGP